MPDPAPGQASPVSLTVVPDADLRIKLPVFEGPLDLLLFLIRKNELDIYDIPIAAVTKQYIEVLRSMQQLDLEIAGEFFVMAASLMEIKSRMLLPRGQAAVGDGDDDDPLDPRWELVHQLLQYKKFKEAAAKLDELAAFQRDMLARHVVEVAVTENERPLKPVDRIELWNAFNLVLRRLAEKLVVGEIKGEEVTVSDKMEELLQLIETRQKFLFTDLFEGKQVTVRLLVATFIAVLELTRLKKLRVRQDEAFADIHVEAVENTLNADGTLAAGQLNFAPEAPDQTAPATPAFRLSADGYAAIPAVIGADAPSAPPVTAAEDATIVPADAPATEPALTDASVSTSESSEPAALSTPAAPAEAVTPIAASTETTPEPAPTVLAATEEAPPAPPLEPDAPPAPAIEVAATETPMAADIATDPATAFEPPPPLVAEQPAPEPERILHQNPLDTEPPRDTLSS